MTPAFHFRILNDFLPVINEQANTLVNKVKNKTDKQVNIVPILCHCALDVICETTMGINIKSQEGANSEYVKTVSRAAELVLLRLMRPWVWSDFIYYHTSKGRTYKEYLRILKGFSMKVIEERKKRWLQVIHDDELEGASERQVYQRLSDALSDGDHKRLAFIDILLYEHIVRKTLSIADVCEEVDTFMFAGHDTTSMAMSWTVYLLGLHEQFQEQVSSR